MDRLKKIDAYLHDLEVKCKEIIKIKALVFDVDRLYYYLEISETDIEVYYSDGNDWSYMDEENLCCYTIDKEDLLKTTEELVQDKQDELDEIERLKLEKIAAEKRAEQIRNENAKILREKNKELKERKEYERLHKKYGKKT